MKALILGGAGYIGSHVCLEFLAAGHHVTVFDNLSSGTKENIFPEEQFVEGDIMDYDALSQEMRKGYDVVVHLAAFKAAGESMLVPEKYARNNIAGTINVLNAMVEHGVKYFVFSSSAAVYGEPSYLPIDEKHPTNPENFYGFTKLEIERILAWYDKLKGIRYAALRYFNAAGYDPEGRVRGLEKNPANLLPVIMEVAAGKRKELQVFGNDYPTKDGTGIRDYVHVSDLAVGHVAALNYMKKNDASLIVNLGSEEGLSVLEILEQARRITGKPIPAIITARRPGDPAKLVAGSQLAQKLLGWKARYSDVETLVKTSWNVYLPHCK
ncbi:MAG TPA: UDP-glucose 4-epimerase GalE [Spirochaetia bacterium]|nr:UDP-glucose 4-epimerase GalE [Spirochaetales bacterium]HPD81307.1 UDP-glucose 4-epimerase GalE [Spirochaetales bacterium]HRS64822.1 UDP-glucose 4-epimerase GalE [Spirochaetia bacterium]HRV29497.1 UDP-glucose 4-epimerase GalE [Spirochaetia bacterium]